MSERGERIPDPVMLARGERRWRRVNFAPPPDSVLEKRINGQNPQVPLAKAPELCSTLQLLLYCARRLVLVGEVKLCREACFKHLIAINSMEKFSAAPRSHVSSRWSLPPPLSSSLASPRAIMLPVDWALGSDSHSEIPPPYLDATRAREPRSKKMPPCSENQLEIRVKLAPTVAKQSSRPGHETRAIEKDWAEGKQNVREPLIAIQVRKTPPPLLLQDVETR